MTARIRSPSSGGQIATVAVVVMVLLTGCSSIFQSAEPTTTEPERTTSTTTPTAETTITTPDQNSTADATTTAQNSTTVATTTARNSTTATTTPDQDPYPPGVTKTGLHNVTALVSAHTSRLVATGFVANAAVKTTVEKSGFLVDVTIDGRTSVERNAATSHEERTVEGGPVTRDVDIWANQSAEYRRRQESGETEYERGPPRERVELSGGTLVEPFLRGGDYELRREIGSGAGKRFVLVATTYDNEKAIMRGLPGDATAVNSYSSTVIVDGDGRIRKFDARVGFVIGGDDKTHRVHFEVATIGGVSVERPEWIDEAVAETNASVVGDRGRGELRGPTSPLERLRARNIGTSTS